MFLAWTELAGQNVSLSRLFGTLNTPSRIVIINSAGNRGPAESWAWRLQSGRRRSFRTNGCSCRWSFTPEQLSTLASPGKHPHTLRGVVWAPEPPSSSLCAGGHDCCFPETPPDFTDDKTTSFTGKRRLGSWKFYRWNDRSFPLGKC